MKNLLIIIAFALASCVNQKRVIRWNDDHPRQAAEYASDKFPCKAGDTTIVTTIDSTGYIESIGELTSALYATNDMNDSLLRVIINNKEAGDTACNEYFPFIFQLSDSLQKLKAQIKNIKPRIITRDTTITKLDSALVVATRLKNEELQKTNNDQGQEIARLKGLSGKRLWMFIASLALNALLIAVIILLVKKKSDPVKI